MNITIRSLVEPEILDVIYSLDQYCFHSSPPYENKEEWLAWARGRKGVICHAVYEGETAVSTAASSAMTQNIRGALYPASGVWGVTSHPAARRKGYIRQAMASLLAAERESGKIFSTLYPFRESFYERLGYVTYPLTKIARFAPQSLAPLLKMDLEGEVELKLIGEAYDLYREYLAEMRLRQHGMAFFDFGDRSMANRNNLWTAIARIGENIEGVMLYRLKGEQVTKFNFEILRFYFKTTQARCLMLNWIARHIDQADRVEMRIPADVYPETWAADLQVSVETAVRAAMGRILDVEKISGMNAGDGGFQARIIDPLCPWNEGSWQFEGRDGRLHVSRTAEGGCDLTIQGLSALVAGTHDPEAFHLRGWGRPNLAEQAAMRNLFPPMCPFLHEIF